MSDVMIEARSLTKRYGDFKALDNVSFEVKRGEVLGFLGPNGAGKTTTMKILTCFIAPTEGTAKVNGCDVFTDPLGVRSSLGYLAEANPLYTEMLVLEFLQWVTRMRGLEGNDARKRLKTVVEQTDIGDVIGQGIATLSKGFRQRVGLAATLMHEPPILILDEPMSGLDPNQTVEIRELIREIGKERTVILSTHSMSEAEKTCDRLLIITKGKIVADDTPEGLRRAAGNTRYYATFAKGGDIADTKKRLGNVPGVARIEEVKAANSSEVRFAIVAKDKTADLREALIKTAVDAGSVLLDLSGEVNSLERRFAELTLGTDPGDAKGKAKKRVRASAKKAEVKKAEAKKAEAKKAEPEEEEEEDEESSEDSEASEDSETSETSEESKDSGSETSDDADDSEDDSDEDDSDEDSDEDDREDDNDASDEDADEDEDKNEDGEK